MNYLIKEKYFLQRYLTNYDNYLKNFMPFDYSKYLVVTDN